jgi:predicted TIM-barrel fold metal-dependent hydrolase
MAQVVDIVDSHHHVWRMRDMPWLSGPMVPRIFGPYEPIKRDYLIDEYIADARSGGITQSVYVQANWPLDQVVAEVRWLNELHQETGWPTAVVGAVDLFSPDAVDVMKKQAELPIVRGTRLQLHWHEREEFRFASAPDRMKEPVFRRNVAALEDLGWLFELQVFPGQLADAAEFVEAVPDVLFVLVHAGMLTDLEDADRPGHLRAAARPRSHHVRRGGDAGLVRRRPRHVRHELPRREAVDRPALAGRRLAGRRAGSRPRSRFRRHRPACVRTAAMRRRTRGTVPADLRLQRDR